MSDLGPVGYYMGKMQSDSDAQLLRAYIEHGAEAAFTELVERHTNLVYSAALRQVESPAAAAEVAQGVFLGLVRGSHALLPRLVPEASLAGWLCRSARNLSLNHRRDEFRRLTRERQAMEQLISIPEDAPEWDHLRPVLDEAMSELEEADYDALVLRFFQQRDYRAVGTALGVSDDTAQKRVTRALDKLRDLLSQRGIRASAAALSVVIAANAVQAAPIGLAATISTATLAGAVVTSAAIITAKTIAMTTLQKILVAATVTILAGAGIYEARQAAELRDENQKLRQQQTPLADQLQQVQKERDDATNRVASLAGELALVKKNPAEVIKLRGEVGTLRQENKLAGEKSAISKITFDPATRKALRDQQKMGMSSIYKDFAKRLNLTPEMTGKLNDLLADNVMDNVDLITQVLHDGKSQAEINQIFSAADTTFQGKVQALLGDDAVAQYKDYTQNLLSSLSATQFSDYMAGDKAAKQDKQNQLQQLLQTTTAAALKDAGLPANYQVVPMLNFANIASEDQANQSLNLLDGIYASTIAQGGSFLSADELASLQTFRTNAININRTVLTMNRKLMAPISQ
ncbi:MAG TPA: sigma-70 family RNA polymerase sigma factor [Verrucomicrobiae bacterium]|nr:sigma-70 family RNA polymerase sigma factor [Verrucomicrobiae bacterium]